MKKNEKKKNKVLLLILLAAAALVVGFFLVKMGWRILHKSTFQTKPIHGTGCFAARKNLGYIIKLANGELRGVSLGVDGPPDRSQIEFDGTIPVEEEPLCRGKLPSLYLTHWTLIQRDCGLVFDQPTMTPVVKK